VLWAGLDLSRFLHLVVPFTREMAIFLSSRSVSCWPDQSFPPGPKSSSLQAPLCALSFSPGSQQLVACTLLPPSFLFSNILPNQSWTLPLPILLVFRPISFIAYLASVLSPESLSPPHRSGRRDFTILFFPTWQGSQEGVFSAFRPPPRAPFLPPRAPFPLFSDFSRQYCLR